MIGQKKHCIIDIQNNLYQDDIEVYDSINDSFEKGISSFLEKRKSFKSETSEKIYTIPVVVHIVHNDATQTPGKPESSNISDEQIFSQIQVLQEDFRRQNSDTSNTSLIFKSLAVDTKIEFCLALRDPSGNSTNGITRHFVNIDSWNVLDPAQYNKLRSYGYWPSSQYLNIWVANLSEDILGIATFPTGSNQSGLPTSSQPAETDGIVIFHKVFGNEIGTASNINNPYNKGRTTVHEIGHWLGLLHTFQGACNGNGDHCDDTPEIEESTSGCPIEQSSCSGRDMTENYMDYTYDACLNMFSSDQKNRMRAVLETDSRRNALLSSPGCCGAESTAQLPLSTDFEENDLIQTQWTVESSSDNLTWEIKDNGKLSTYSLYANCESSNNDTTNLLSSIIDFSTADIPAISFDMAYNSENPTTVDRFIISYEKACDETWIVLKEFSKEEIQTTEGKGANFSPSEEEWKSHYLQLPELKTLFAVKLRVQIISKNNGSFYLDNINLFSETPEPLFSIYPNPASSNINVKFSHQLKRSASITMYDVLGTIINTYEIPKSFSQTYTISTSSITNGMYIVVLKSDDFIQKEKLVIHK